MIRMRTRAICTAHYISSQDIWCVLVRAVTWYQHCYRWLDYNDGYNCIHWGWRVVCSNSCCIKSFHPWIHISPTKIYTPRWKRSTQVLLKERSLCLMLWCWPIRSTESTTFVFPSSHKSLLLHNPCLCNPYPDWSTRQIAQCDTARD